MNGDLLPHRNKNPRWCDWCKRPPTNRLARARYIWHRAGHIDEYLCPEHAEDVRAA